MSFGFPEPVSSRFDVQVGLRLVAEARVSAMPDAGRGVGDTITVPAAVRHAASIHWIQLTGVN